ncbi:hypothetical protein [Novosphingobium sp. 9]|uniref:hypothetical protein n=1 Tax=Novosphingobium sp. 9 TaxID=2025349 RepID=UPI0021B61617|nr:hypothetical protein [Novosphingobium sp. 9]
MTQDRTSGRHNALPGLGRRAFLQSAAASGTAMLASPVLAQVESARLGHAKPERMSYLANGTLRLGIDLAKGGAITFLADLTRGPDNLINSFDLGRQVQMSYYSGPVPYRVPGHAGPRPRWEEIGWNPIQVGDDFGNASRILEHRNDGREIYVKCVPMHWPLDDVPGECTFESWLRLDGNTVQARCRLVMARQDRTQWPARQQELPAVYTNGPWYQLWSYRGDRPFIGDTPTEIQHPFENESPWAEWAATENWAALLDDSGHGLGVWSPETTWFSGGFYGKKGSGGPKDEPTGYIGPSRLEIIDHNIVHDYRYTLICGDLGAIRQWVYAQPRPPALPSWEFARDRQGWTYVDATDSGWPIRGQLDIRPAKGAQIIGPPAAWQAAQAKRLTIRGVFEGIDEVALLWRPLDSPDFVGSPSAIAKVRPERGVQSLSFNLSRCSEYRGLVTQLRLDPQLESGPTARIALHSIAFG